MNINIIGAGVNPSKHLTLEAVKYLQESEVVLSLLNKEDNNFLKILGVSVEPITHLYRNNSKDMNNYYDILNHVKSLSLSKKNISLIMPGHPRLGVTITQIIKNFFREFSDIQFNITTGISSFATMYNDLRIDPLEAGTVLLDVNRLLLYEYQIEKSLNYFIYHICSIGNQRTNFKNPQKDNQVQLLKRYLLKFYDNSCKVFMIESAWGNLNQPKIKSSTIGNIELLLGHVNFNSTLYIPGIKKDNLDRQFLNLLQN